MRRLAAALLVALMLTAGTAPPVVAHDGFVRAVNRFRLNHDRPPLKTNANLDRIAHIRARQIVTAFHHDFWWWSETNCGWVGENIAYRKPPPEKPIRWLMRAFKNSPFHRANMLGDWRRIGAAYLVRDGGLWGVQVFCKPR